MMNISIVSISYYDINKYNAQEIFLNIGIFFLRVEIWINIMYIHIHVHTLSIFLFIFQSSEFSKTGLIIFLRYNIALQDNY